MADGESGFTKPQLTPEQGQRLLQSEELFDAADATLRDLEEIGLDVSPVRAQVEQGRSISRGLRQRFMPTGGRRGRRPS